MTDNILTVDLYETAQVKLDGSGNGTAFISPVGPRNGGLRWEITACAVKASSNVLEAAGECFVSYGLRSTDAGSSKGQTATGSSGDTCGLAVTIRPNDYVSVKWTGGDVGAIATMVLTGTIYPPGT